VAAVRIQTLLRVVPVDTPIGRVLNVVLGVEVVGRASDGDGSPTRIGSSSTATTTHGQAAIRGGALREAALLLRHHHDGILVVMMRCARHNVATRQLLDDAAAHGGSTHALAEFFHDFVHGAGRSDGLETRGGR